MKLDILANHRVLDYLSGGDPRPSELAIKPSESKVDPYRELGCHPDAVEWVWERLAKPFGQSARQIVLDRPALVAPASGEIIAMAFGTAYLIKLPESLNQQALAAGYRTQRTWSDGSSTELANELGAGWWFGQWEEAELDWLGSSYSGADHPD